MNKILLSLITFLFPLLLQAQTFEIRSSELETLRKSFNPSESSNTALMNAISSNKISDIAIQRKNLGKIDHQFKYKVNVQGITNQESSGRCWMFTSLNSLRPQVAEKYNLSKFQFSENYLYFWDLLEKSNLFLNLVIQHSDKPLDDRMNEWLFKNPISDGGVWNSFSNIVDKYGLVPSSVMPETYHSSNTRTLNTILSRKLREHALELRNYANNELPEQKLQEIRVNMLKEIYRILVLSLGEPPQEFEYRFVDKEGNIGNYVKYTPLSFYKAVLPDYNAENYVMLMNDPTRDYYRLYEIEYDRNVMEGKNWTYINLPNKELKNIAIESIKANEAIYASCDVGKQLSKANGTLDLNNYNYSALYGVEFNMDKKDRIRSKESGSSHAMLLMAVDVDQDENPVMW
jgi:bleomycin hydrolase